jgi:hypothetical protein
MGGQTVTAKNLFDEKCNLLFASSPPPFTYYKNNYSEYLSPFPQSTIIAKKRKSLYIDVKYSSNTYIVET